MYQVNDAVLYGAQGVCRIVEIAEKDFGGTSREYYVLKPVFHESSTIFVPVTNEALTAKMKRILSVEEIHGLIHGMPEEASIWIENDAVRKEKYKELLMSGDRMALIRLIKTLHQHQEQLQARGKKLHAADERIFRDAERMLYEEFAHVLKIKKEQVVPFIIEEIELVKK